MILIVLYCNLNVEPLPNKIFSLFNLWFIQSQHYCIFVMLHFLSFSVRFVWCSDVPRGRGDLGVQTPPEIPKFWQSWAKIPGPWEIHLLQSNKYTGFTHLKIERNPWLGGYRLQISVLSALNWISWTPLKKSPGYTTDQNWCNKEKML
jgi:hypothetical protein